MCYWISVTTNEKDLAKAFGATSVNPKLVLPIYSASAFTYPELPVITNDAPEKIDLLTWGLIPFWVKDSDAAGKIRSRTINARSETLTIKPSFRQSAKSRRCLVLADGFFEWRHENSQAFPYYVRLKNREPFAIAGIWDIWTDPENQDRLRTFSVITTEANSLLAIIHNTKKRMPVILPKEAERKWLENQDTAVVNSLLRPYDAGEMEAYTVSKAVSKSGFNISDPGVLNIKDYPELPEL